MPLTPPPHSSIRTGDLVVLRNGREHTEGYIIATLPGGQYKVKWVTGLGYRDRITTVWTMPGLRTSPYTDLPAPCRNPGAERFASERLWSGAPQSDSRLLTARKAGGHRARAARSDGQSGRRGATLSVFPEPARNWAR